jgi:hypothetical protein
VPKDLARDRQTVDVIAPHRLRRERGERRDRRHLWIAGILGALGLCVSFIADGVRTLQTEGASTLSNAEESDRQQAAIRTPSIRQIGASILTRNIFDSQTGPLTWEDTPEPAQAPPDAPAPTVQPPSSCEGSDLRLIASVVNAVRPEHSFAALSKDRRTHLLGIGGQLGDVTLLALRPAFAYVQSGSAPPCVLPVFLPRSQRPKPQPEAPKVIHVDAREPAARGKSLFSKQEVAAAIRPLGNGRYAVSKAFLTRALRNPSGAARGARLRPVERYGRTIGWELARLRKDALLAHMGLQKGDLLKSANGHELSDAGSLLVALRMLQQADSVTLAILRGSTAQNIQYTLE